MMVRVHCTLALRELLRKCGRTLRIAIRKGDQLKVIGQAGKEPGMALGKAAAAQNRSTQWWHRATSFWESWVFLTQRREGAKAQAVFFASSHLGVFALKLFTP
jgi:hypothetical protein